MDIDSPALQLKFSDDPKGSSDRSPCFNIDFAITEEPLRFTTAPAAHLSSARAALNETRRMKKKRKSVDNLTEIRKQEDRVTKKICNARTRRGSVPCDGGASVLDEHTTVVEQSAVSPPEIQVLIQPTRRFDEGNKSVHKSLHLQTNHNRIATVKAAKRDETVDVLQIDYRKRGFVARKVRSSKPSHHYLSNRSHRLA
jgi:hypothetical protein